MLLAEGWCGHMRTRWELVEKDGFVELLLTEERENAAGFADRETFSVLLFRDEARSLHGALDEWMRRCHIPPLGEVS